MLISRANCCWNFPWNRPIFLRICPWKSFESWLFSTKIPRNRPIFFCEFWLFSCKNPVKLADFSAKFGFFPVKSADFSANLPLKIPRNFAFFSAKYQKPCWWEIAFSQMLPRNKKCTVTSYYCMMLWKTPLDIYKYRRCEFAAHYVPCTVHTLCACFPHNKIINSLCSELSESQQCNYT